MDARSAGLAAMTPCMNESDTVRGVEAAAPEAR